MSVHDFFDAERNLLIVTLDGPLQDEDLLKYARRVTESSDIPAGHDELIDLRTAEEPQVSSHTLRRVADMFARTDRTPDRTRVALVAESDVAYGLSRMYQAFRSESPLDLRVFRQMAEARVWLGLDAD
jgi:hypothetical protein